MLAYVFWHWKQPQIAAGEYESRQRTFHAALAAAPSRGFARSFSGAVSGAPWAAEGGEAYEDWYLVHDFAALGALNEAAVSASRAASHDRAAAVAAGGAAGVYALQHGTPIDAPAHACWFGKPAGLSYGDLLAQLTPLVERDAAALWMRQMVLGPAREFCVHAHGPMAIPASFEVLALSLRPVWQSPGAQAGGDL